MTDDEKSDMTDYKPVYVKPDPPSVSQYSIEASSAARKVPHSIAPDLVSDALNVASSHTADPLSARQSSTNASNADMTDKSGSLKSDSPVVTQSSTDTPDPARIELSKANLIDLKTRLAKWCDNGRINLHLLKVVISEFENDDIALADIVKKENTHDLIELLTTAGYLKPTDIRILFDVINLCGVGGVETVMKKEWKLPEFKDVPITHFSDRRIRLLAFGRKLSIKNMIILGHLYEIPVNKDTDPYSLISQLEETGSLAEGDKWNEFIGKLKDYDMNNEIKALTG